MFDKVFGQRDPSQANGWSYFNLVAHFADEGGTHAAGGTIPLERREVGILRDERGVGYEKESYQRQQNEGMVP